MLNYIIQLLGMDLAAYHIPDEILFIVSALFVLFIFGELFNIVRSLIDRR